MYVNDVDIKLIFVFFKGFFEHPIEYLYYLVDKPSNFIKKNQKNRHLYLYQIYYILSH